MSAKTIGNSRLSETFFTFALIYALLYIISFSLATLGVGLHPILVVFLGLASSYLILVFYYTSDFDF